MHNAWERHLNAPKCHAEGLGCTLLRPRKGVITEQFQWLPSSGRNHNWVNVSRQWIEVDDRGRALALPRRHVGEGRPALLPQTAILMDVSEQVQAWHHLQDACAQLLAA